MAMSRQQKRGPNKGEGGATREQQRAPFWLTAEAYRVLGKEPPPDVLETDRELGLEPR